MSNDQFMQNQYYQHATDFWMTIQAERIAFRINNPAKLDTGPYTYNGCIYVHTLNCTSSTLAVRIEIHVWLYPNRDPCVAISQQIKNHLVVSK